MAASPPYYIGVDGGGTRCSARLQSADGRLLGAGQGGAANILLGLDPSWSSILDAIDAALAQAGLDRSILSATTLGLGLAGITVAADGDRIAAMGPGFATVRVASDAHVACLGAFSGRDGAIMITGTGCAGYAWLGGRGHAIGCWGFDINDDASAATLGRNGIRKALNAHDGLIPPTDFTRALMEKFGGHPSDIVGWSVTARPRDYGALAPLVMRFAEQGDPVAVDLVENMARILDRYVVRLRDIGAATVCLVGGLAPSLAPWLSASTRSLLHDAEHDAVDGALLLARGAADGLSSLEQR